MMVLNHPTPQNSKHYLRRSTKPVQNKIPRLSNFWLQNSSNLVAAIQIFLCLHEPNSPIFHSSVTFPPTLNKCLHFERDDLCLQGFLPLTSDNKPHKFSASEQYTTKERKKSRSKSDLT